MAARRVSIASSSVAGSQLDAPLGAFECTIGVHFRGFVQTIHNSGSVDILHFLREKFGTLLELLSQLRPFRFTLLFEALGAVFAYMFRSVLLL
jgi:hypothetical protein